MLEVLVTRFELFWVHLWGPDIISSGKPRTIPVIIDQISAMPYSSWRSCYYRGVGRDVLEIDSYILRAVDMYGIRGILVVRLHTRITHCRLMLRGVGPTGTYLHSWIVFFTWYLRVSSCLLFIQVYDKTSFLGYLFQWIIELELWFWELKPATVRWHHRSGHFTWCDMCGRVLHLL